MVIPKRARQDVASPIGTGAKTGSTVGTHTKTGSHLSAVNQNAEVENTITLSLWSTNYHLGACHVCLYVCTPLSGCY